MKSFALALAALATVFSIPDARACGMSIRLEGFEPQAKPTPVQEVARAEQGLESGQNAVAARTVLRTFPKLRVATAGRDPLETRAIRVFALAVVRSDGALSEKSLGVPTKDEWAPTGNLAWAIQSLREIDQNRPNDPAVQADLAEALAKTQPTQEEALGILQRLAEKDLMGSPHAYAALSKLRSARGDVAGAEAAQKRCEEMAHGAGICKAKPIAKA